MYNGKVNFVVTYYVIEKGTYLSFLSHFYFVLFSVPLYANIILKISLYIHKLHFPGSDGHVLEANRHLIINFRGKKSVKLVNFDILKKLIKSILSIREFFMKIEFSLF